MSETQTEEQFIVPMDDMAGNGTELIWVGGPHPYLWIGDERGAFASLDIPPELADRTRCLLRDLAEEESP